MKIRILATGEVAEYNDSYAARLIEQGKAVVVREASAADSAEKADKGKKG